MVSLSRHPFGDALPKGPTAIGRGLRALVAALPQRHATLASRRLELLLAPDRPLRLEGARGHVIHCVAGRIWITAEGLAGDVFLVPGEHWTISANGLVLAEALQVAAVAEFR